MASDRGRDTKQAARTAKFESNVQELAKVQMALFYPHSPLGVWPTAEKAPDLVLMRALLAELEATDQVGTWMFRLCSAQSHMMPSDSLLMRK